MADYLRRAWAEIDLDAITYNFHLLRGRLAPGCKTLAVVKADAYGHGDGPVARALEAAGADWFAVSNLNEALSLRRQGITRPILVLGYTPPELAAVLSSQRIAQAVVGPDYAQALSQAAVAAGVEVDCHMAVDTGMSRIGFYAQGGREAEAAREIAAASRLPGLTPQGIFTHFAVADEGAADSQAFTQGQYDCFCETIRLAQQEGVTFPLRHCCNSAASLLHPQWGLDMVRLGIVLYGAAPSAHCQGQAALHPAMSLRAVVSRVQQIGPGAAVSYGRHYTAPEPRQVATLAVGYADGYRRAWSGKAHVLLHGRVAPVLGSVCMDQMMVDVTGIPGVAPGDVATLAGRDGQAQITLDQLAAWDGSIPYEVACLVTRRVPRVYLREGRQVEAKDFFLPTL